MSGTECRTISRITAFLEEMVSTSRFAPSVEKASAACFVTSSESIFTAGKIEPEEKRVCSACRRKKEEERVREQRRRELAFECSVAGTARFGLCQS